MPTTDQLQIVSPNGESTLYPLDPARGTTRIGRHKENDLIIDSPAIALFQAVLHRQAQRYRIVVVDPKRKMTLYNEFYNAGSELRPNVPNELRDGDKIEVNGYSIVLMQGREVMAGGSLVTAPAPVPATVNQRPGASSVPPVAALPAEPSPTRSAQVDRGQADETTGPAAPPSDRLDDSIIVELPVRKWTVDVEQTATCRVSVANGGSLVAMFDISVKGLDASWVTITPPQVNLNEGERAEVTVAFKAPRLPTSRAGAYQAFVVVTSHNYPGHRSRQMVTLKVNPYYEFTVGELAPRQQILSWFKSTGRATWTISNKGNSEMPFRLNGADDAGGCRVEFEIPGRAGRIARQAELSLQPDQSVEIPVYTTPLARPWVAPSQSTYSLTVTASPLAGQPASRSSPGQVQYTPLISLTLLLALLGAMVLVCSAAGWGLYSFLNPTPTPEPTVAPSPVVVPTAVLAPTINYFRVAPEQAVPKAGAVKVTLYWSVIGDNTNLEITAPELGLKLSNLDREGSKEVEAKKTTLFVLTAYNQDKTTSRTSEFKLLDTPTPTSVSTRTPVPPTPTVSTRTPVPPTPTVPTRTPVPPTPITPSPVPPPVVTNVTASVSPASSSSCPAQFNFSAAITVNGPGTVTYVWERSDGASAPTQSLTFGSAGPQTVNNTWTLSGSYSGWERVRILTPNALVSNQAGFALNCPTVPPDTLPAPLLYLSFNGNIADRSKSSLATQATGSIEFVQGMYGLAAQFDGSGEAVEVSKAASLAIADEMTLEFWVNMAKWKNPYQGSAHVESIANLGAFYSIDVNFDTWTLAASLTTESTGNSGVRLQGGQLSPGQWHHVALVYRGKEKNAFLFLDGKQVDAESVSGRIPPNNPNPFKVGTWYQQNQAFSGLVDELRLYNVGLDNKLIQELAKNPR